MYSAKYMKTINKILCLEQVSEHFYVYDDEGKIFKKIKMNPELHYQDPRILSIAWSESEERIGASVQDRTLSFFDWKDQFTYEHVIKAKVDYSFTSIWFVEYCNAWIALDPDNVFHKWDIYQETQINFPKVHQQVVTDFIEVLAIPAVIASSLDKKIVVWDMEQCVSLATLSIDTVSAHTLSYSPTFEVMFSAGYETEICMWTFAKSLDITMSKKLTGHNAQVAALHILESQHILLSADDIGYIKTWDIATLTCIQSYYFETRIPLSKIITVSEYRFIVVGNRLYFFDFEIPEIATKKPKHERYKSVLNTVKEKMHYSAENEITAIIDVVYANQKKVLYVATTKDIRVYDMNLGKCLRVYRGFIKENEEIIHVTLSSNQDFIIVGDTIGKIKWINASDGLVARSYYNNSQVTALYTIIQYNTLLSIRANVIFCL